MACSMSAGVMVTTFGAMTGKHLVKMIKYDVCLPLNERADPMPGSVRFKIRNLLASVPSTVLAIAVAPTAVASISPVLPVGAGRGSSRYFHGHVRDHEREPENAARHALVSGSCVAGVKLGQISFVTVFCRCVYINRKRRRACLHAKRPRAGGRPRPRNRRPSQWPGQRPGQSLKCRPRRWTPGCGAWRARCWPPPRGSGRRPGRARPC